MILADGVLEMLVILERILLHLQLEAARWRRYLSVMTERRTETIIGIEGVGEATISIEGSTETIIGVEGVGEATISIEGSTETVIGIEGVGEATISIETGCRILTSATVEF